jgi:S-(hydroxymethyl)glutathione dehydrogenase/alcohol dehydrogenase
LLLDALLDQLGKHRLENVQGTRVEQKALIRVRLGTGRGGRPYQNKRRRRSASQARKNHHGLHRSNYIPAESGGFNEWWLRHEEFDRERGISAVVPAIACAQLPATQDEPVHERACPTMIRAAVCREFGKPLTIEEIELAAPKAGEIEIDIKACAICHSDISYAEGDWGGPLPAVYGHEAAGIVRRTGRGVTGFKPGDHVVITLIRSCGKCHYCAQGSTVVCTEVFNLDEHEPIRSPRGEPLSQPLKTAAFAERVIVHQSQIAKVAKSIPFASAALLACGVITGFGAVINTAQVQSGEAVAVIGCGGVGLNAIQGAVHAGARPIIAIDVADVKLRDARTFGAAHAFNPDSVDVRAAVRKLTKKRGADYVFVTVGAKSAMEGALRLITRNGHVIVVGMPPSGVLAQYDPSILAAWNQKIMGSKMGEAIVARDIPKLAKAYRGGELKLDELVSNTYPLEKINEAIAEAKSGTVRRNVIVFD